MVSLFGNVDIVVNNAGFQTDDPEKTIAVFFVSSSSSSSSSLL
jgi:hypothetical protein